MGGAAFSAAEFFFFFFQTFFFFLSFPFLSSRYLFTPRTSGTVRSAPKTVTRPPRGVLKEKGPRKKPTFSMLSFVLEEAHDESALVDEE